MSIASTSNQHTGSRANRSPETSAVHVNMPFVHENASFNNFGMELKKFHSFQKCM